MIIEQTMQGVRITDYIDNLRVSRHFIGYSLTEAKRLFRKVMREAHESLILNQAWSN